MRFAVFLALLVATFMVCTSSFASAKNLTEGFAVFDEAEDNVARRLHAAHGVHAHAHAAHGVNQENVAKIAGGFITKMKESATLTKAIQMAKAANGDEAAAKKAIMLAAGAKEGAKMSDETLAKLAAMVAESVKKNPKSWSRLHKFAKISLGVGAGALVVYTAYKLLFAENSSGATFMDTTTNTTSGSGSA